MYLHNSKMKRNKKNLISKTRTKIRRSNLRKTKHTEPSSMTEVGKTEHFGWQSQLAILPLHKPAKKKNPNPKYKI